MQETKLDYAKFISALSLTKKLFTFKLLKHYLEFINLIKLYVLSSKY